MKHLTAAAESFCVCGVQIELGDSIVMVQGRAAHVNCQTKAAQHAPTDQQIGLWRSDFLFDDTQREALGRAEEITGAEHVSFDGDTIETVDIVRLAGQCARVFELMRDGQFRTLSQIARLCSCLETSAGARLRDLRKPRFGGHTVESRQAAGTTLLYEYRVILNNGRTATEANEQRQAA